MKSMIRMELKRALLNHMFLIAVLLGSLFAVMQAVSEALPYAFGLELFPDQYPPSVFNSCMGLTLGVWPYIFYMVFPILASIPYANSYLQDVKTGFLKNIYLKAKKHEYLTAKLLAVFLSGGLAAFLPVALNYFLVSLCVPAVTPHAASGFFLIFSQATGAELFYTNPHLYVFLFALLLFLTAGIFACTALAFSFFIRYSYVVLLTPFLLFLSISYGSTLFARYNSWNVSQWIVPYQNAGPINIMVALLELAILFFTTIIVYYYRGLRDDTI